MPRAILTGLLWSLLTGLFLALVAGVLLYFTPLSEGLLPLMASVILALAVFGGGLQAARIAAARGFFQGMGVGLSFFLVTLALGWSVAPLVLAATAKKLGLCLLAGAMGGMAGMAGR